MATVYRKTAKGVLEIDTRAHRLTPRQRSALILVDGKKTDDELTQLILAEPAATLASLLADGFIEVLATLADRPAERAPERKSAARPDSGSGATLESVRRDSVRELNHQIGPLAEDLALKIERCKSTADLQPLLAQAAAMLHRLRGAASGDAFAARFVAPREA